MFKTKIYVYRLSAGIIEDNGMYFASLTYLDDNIRKTVDKDRIDIGQVMAKIPVITDDNNALAVKMSSLPFPCEVELHLRQSISGGKMSLVCDGFTPLSPKSFFPPLNSKS